MKIKKAIIFNINAYIISAIFGLLMNFAIGYFYKAAVLGLFNTVFAIYIIASQFSVFGQNFTVLSHTASQNENERKETLINSIFIALLSSIIILILLLLISIFANDIFSSNTMRISIILSALALPFFSLNKVMLNYLNAILENKKFSILKTIRIILITVSIFIISYLKWPGQYLTASFIFSEVIICVILFYNIIHDINLKLINIKKTKELVIFGKNSLTIGLVAEINTRLDVICLNLFVSDRLVGIYSFALIFAEGVYQLYVAVREIINPHIAKLKNQKNYKYKNFFSQTNLMKNYVLALLGLVVGIPIFNFIINLDFFIKFNLSLLPFIILLISILLNSYFIILGNYFLISKLPLIETKISIGVVLVNIILNLLLIPIFGIAGAAIATALSYFVASLLQIYYARKLKV